MAYAAAAAAVIAIAGGVLQGISQKRQAEAQAEAIEDQGRQDLRDAYAEERNLRRRRALVQGEARTAIGRSGVTIEGSPLEFLAQNAAEIEVEALGIRTYGINARRQSRAQASALRSEGRQALYGGILGGVSSGLGAYATGVGSFSVGRSPRPAPRALTLPAIAYSSGRPVQPYRVP